MYEATGEVTIDRSSGGRYGSGSSSSSSSSSNYRPVSQTYKSSGSTTKVHTTSSSTTSGGKTTKVVAPVITQTTGYTYNVPRVSFSEGSASSSDRSKGRLTDLRKVSVKYPTRKTNVIPFFVPADHKYEATSIVKIDREA